MREAQELREREAEAQAAFIASAPITVDTQSDSIAQPNPEQVTAESGPSVTENESSGFIEDTKPVPSAPPTETTGPTEGEPPESLHLTATDPNLAHVLPEPVPGHVPTATNPSVVPPMSMMEGMTLSEGAGQSAHLGAPSAPPPPAYNQVSYDHVQ